MRNLFCIYLAFFNAQARILDLHMSETHDVFFQILSERQDMVRFFFLVCVCVCVCVCFHKMQCVLACACESGFCEMSSNLLFLGDLSPQFIVSMSR